MTFVTCLYAGGLVGLVWASGASLTRRHMPKLFVVSCIALFAALLLVMYLVYVGQPPY